MSIFGVFRLHVFCAFTAFTAYLSVFSPNAGKYGPEKLRIRHGHFLRSLYMTAFRPFTGIIKNRFLVWVNTNRHKINSMNSWSIEAISHSMFRFLHCVKSAKIRSFFWSVFSHIRNDHGDLRSKSPFSVRIWKNTDQNKLRIWTLFTQYYRLWWIQQIKSPFLIISKQQWLVTINFGSRHLEIFCKKFVSCNFIQKGSLWISRDF